ncbi:MAG: helix-turn-helix transcriptional regulator [Actinomycetota bacterium]
MDAATYLNQARRAAGLTQRELAARSGVPQPAIARIERGRQVPRYDTLVRLLKACGHELQLEERDDNGVNRGQVRSWLALSPADRSKGLVAYGRFLDRLQQARKVS